MTNPVYDYVNEKVDALLAAGVIPWRKPWAGEALHPRSIDGRPYSGINPFLLQLAGYADPRFLTARKAIEMGGTIKQGEKGHMVVFWKMNAKEETNADTGKVTKKRIPILRYFTVFNVAQVEGIEFPPLTVVPVVEVDTTIAERAIREMPNKPSVRYVRGDSAHYAPSKDEIVLPLPEQFGTVPGFFEAAVHEHVHSTGHKSRLNRDGIDTFDHFGSGRYAREELIAAFGTAYLMGEFGLEPEGIENVAAYIANWRQTIVDDKQALVVAAGRGQRAADYVLGRIKVDEDEVAA